MKIRKEVINLKIQLRVDAPTFYNDPEDLLSLLELIIGLIDAGNDNSKMKNRGMAILDELLKLRVISKFQHKKLYIDI